MKKLILLIQVCLLSSVLIAQQPDQNEGVINGNEAQHEGNEDRRAEEQGDREAIDGAIGNLQEFMNWLEERRNDWDQIRNFSPTDCAPDFGASSQAMMPS